MISRTPTRMDPERVAAIVDLKNNFGSETDLRLVTAYGALEDLLEERLALLSEVELIRPGRPHDPTCPLRREEITVLIYAGNGHGNDVCAQATDQNAHTIRSRRKAAFRKLGVRTVAQAIAICMASGWITPADIVIPQRPE